MSVDTEVSGDPMLGACRPQERSNLARGLDACAQVLLDERSGADLLRTTSARLYQLLLAAAGEPDSTESRLATGRALSGRDAATCVLDYRRTATYLRAVDRALGSAAAHWPGQRLRVLYTGCGPWAPLLLVLASRWSGRLAITLVDVHAQSLRMAADLFAQIDQSAALVDAICVDACTLCVDDDQRPHVLVIEIMQRALEHEAQLAVTARLAPQLMPGGMLVPQRILVDAVLVRMSDERASDETASDKARSEEVRPRPPAARIPLAHLIEVSLDTAPALAHQIVLNTTSLPAIDVQVAADTPGGLSVMLRTRIEVGPGLFLEEFESGITHPAYVHALGTVKPDDHLSFKYALGARPGFTCVWRSAPDADNPRGFTAPNDRSVR